MTTLALHNFSANQRHKRFSTACTASTLCHTMHDQESDEVLMLRYQKGDNHAFDLLFKRHKDAIFRYVERQCVTAIAEEIFQDVCGQFYISRL